eukprot:PhM_4_TR15195/c0_g1_i2/m.34948
MCPFSSDICGFAVRQMIPPRLCFTRSAMVSRVLRVSGSNTASSPSATAQFLSAFSPRLLGARAKRPPGTRCSKNFLLAAATSIDSVASMRFVAAEEAQRLCGVYVIIPFLSSTPTSRVDRGIFGAFAPPDDSTALYLGLYDRPADGGGRGDGRPSLFGMEIGTFPLSSNRLVAPSTSYVVHPTPPPSAARLRGLTYSKWPRIRTVSTSPPLTPFFGASGNLYERWCGSTALDRSGSLLYVPGPMFEEVCAAKRFLGARAIVMPRVSVDDVFLFFDVVSSSGMGGGPPGGFGAWLASTSWTPAMPKVVVRNG